jgi:DNA-directed RNA polymerase specialized sigma24 family protein
MNHAETLRAQFLLAKEETPFERRLKNWVRWSIGASLYGAKGHCYSIEHRYKSSDIFYSPDAPIPVDSKDAEAFDRAYRDLLTQSPSAAYVIRAVYIKFESDGKIAGFIGCRLSDVSKRIQDSLKALEKCLHILEKRV